MQAAANSICSVYSFDLCEKEIQRYSFLDTAPIVHPVFLLIIMISLKTLSYPKILYTLHRDCSRTLQLVLGASLSQKIF